MSRRAKDRAEYDEAQRMIQWLKTRADDMPARGDRARVAVIVTQLVDLFLMPDDTEPT